MKLKITYLVVLITALSISSCNSNKIVFKDNQKKVSFNLVSATYENWAGGQPGVIGLYFNVKIDHPQVQLTKIYFRNSATTLRPVSGDNFMFKGIYTYPRDQKSQSLTKDSKGEYGNTAPIRTAKDGEITPDESAIVEYTYKGKKYYFNIKQLERKPMSF